MSADLWTEISNMKHPRAPGEFSLPIYVISFAKNFQEPGRRWGGILIMRILFFFAG
jgi:hypothetical protein